MTVAARKSAFIISLFAFWLDRQGQPIVYFDSLRKGLFMLIKAGILPAVSGIQLGANKVEVRTSADHQACVELFEYLASQASQIKQDAYWAENFCYWVTLHFHSLNDPSATLVKESDDTDLLVKSAAQMPKVLEPVPVYALTQSATDGSAHDGAVLIPHEPLRPVPEPALKQRIQEVQRFILIDELMIRRIYRALLDGHLILTGPPGTGKTELARLIPELLWRNEVPSDNGADTITAYATRLVTATDEWSVRTLIGGIIPRSRDGSVTYVIQHGYLTTTIHNNWSFDPEKPEEWNMLRRKLVTAQSGIQRGKQQTYRGQWLIIDEFNRAPIDLALGDALTALGGNDVLRIPIEGGSAELPIPYDFRVIGTLNSFDRNYLNQISEALKRRFSFIDILPPGRTQRSAEQAIVLYKALKKISHLSDSIHIEEDIVYWQSMTIEFNESGMYTITWLEEQAPFREAFETAWSVFEVIRIYRKLGTAQAIMLIRRMLIAGILQKFTTLEAWIECALDEAFCDTVADQLQLLLPDEIEALLLYLTLEPAEFGKTYNTLLGRLVSLPQRLHGQLRSLSSVCNDAGQPFLSDSEIEQIMMQDRPAVALEYLTSLFHLNRTRPNLSLFRGRLRAFKVERGL